MGAAAVVLAAVVASVVLTAAAEDQCHPLVDLLLLGSGRDDGSL